MKYAKGITPLCVLTYTLAQSPGEVYADKLKLTTLRDCKVITPKNQVCAINLNALIDLMDLKDKKKKKDGKISRHEYIEDYRKNLKRGCREGYVQDDILCYLINYKPPKKCDDKILGYSQKCHWADNMISNIMRIQGWSSPHYAMDVNGDGYVSKKDDLNKDNKITREDKKLYRKQKRKSRKKRHRKRRR
tara:strand:- start:966 stop:1535 length:570 start_codon:yes stop_codon:yes gene_type:complete